MEKGVLRPSPPTLEAVQESPLGKRKDFYTLRVEGKYGSEETLGICFETAEQANAFLALKPFRRDYNYETGSENAYAEPIVDSETVISPLFEKKDVIEFSSTLKQRKAAIENNQKLEREYRSAMEKVDAASRGVWEDWYKQIDLKRQLKSIITTLGEYKTMTGGDVELATKFLKKVHSAELIQTALEWFPECGIPVLPVAADSAHSQP